MTIYIIECKQAGDWVMTRPIRDKLGRDIARLAKTTGAKVKFYSDHAFIDNAPYVMIECDKEFLAKAGRIEGAVCVRQVPQGIHVFSNDRIQGYYFQTGCGKPAGPTL